MRGKRRTTERRGSLYSCTNKNKWSVSIQEMNKENKSGPDFRDPQRTMKG